MFALAHGEHAMIRRQDRSPDAGDAPTNHDALLHGLGRVSALALALVRAEGATPVRATVEAAAAAIDLDLALRARGRPLDEVLDALVRLFAATPATTGPRFWNQLFGGREAAATVADMLACLANNSMYTYKVAGPQVLVENAVLERLMAIAGFAGGEAIIAPGGSMSNLCALLAARNEAFDNARGGGADGRRARVYVSADAHYSLRKAAMVAGIGRDNVVAIDVDRDGRLDPAALAAAIAADRDAGLVPVMVNATAGTTVRGAFDPIDAMADVCAAHQVWLHVDGAFGGSLLLSPTSAGRLDGLARADSFTWDAHKLMGVPLVCSALMVRQRGLLSRHLGENASYLFQGDGDELNPGTRSLQCGRRNDAVKLWAAWQHFGDDGWQARIERQLALACGLADRIEARPSLRLIERPPSLTVCFVADGVASEAICARLAAEQRQLIGHANVAGEVVIRAAVVDPSHSEADLDGLLDDIEAAADALR